MLKSYDETGPWELGLAGEWRCLLPDEKCFHMTFCRRMRNLKPSTIRISFKTFKLFVGGPGLGPSCGGYWIFYEV